MADISDNIGVEDLRSIVFLLSSSLSRERQDGIQVKYIAQLSPCV